MILPDVNVLLVAHREELPDHEPIASWLTEVVNGARAYGMADLVLSGFVRLATHPAVFSPPTPLPVALDFAAAVRDRPNCVQVAPGARHWEIFTSLCERGSAKGNLVADAYLAALAIESGSEWVTADRDFARFEGLRWRHPLEAG